MPRLLKKLRISSVDLCRRGANPLARIALSKSEGGEDWRVQLRELARGEMSEEEVAEELRLLAQQLAGEEQPAPAPSAHQTAAPGRTEADVAERILTIAGQYGDMCGGAAKLRERLEQLYAADAEAFEEYVDMLDELAEARRVKPLMKEYGSSRRPGGVLEARVAEIMRAEPTLTRAQAVVRAYQTDPDIPEVL